jgi:hypothetical protein
MIRSSFATLICLVFCVCGFNVFGGLVISEFMAANASGIVDQDGDSSDWIEIHNDSAATLSLAGWHLTDSAGDLTKWTFPATNVVAGGYLIVFASGKNRAVAGAELHTSFDLSSSGEYLALVQPDGVTIAQEFSPTFPPQRENISYGLALPTTITELVSTGATARVLVPSNGTLGLTWTATGFNDTQWLALSTPVGFSLGLSASPVLAIDVNERGVDPAANTQAGFVSFVINSNVSSTTIQTQATTRVYGGLSITVSNTAPLGYDDRLRTTPVNSGAFTDSLLLRDFIFSRDDTGTGGLDTTIAGLATNRSYRLTLWSFDSGSPGNRVSDWTANGVSVTNGYTFNGSTLPTSKEQYRFTFDTVSDGSGRILVSGRRNPASSVFGVFINALEIDSLASQPATNGLGTLMWSNNASAYVRIPFAVEDATAFQTLKLRIRYDDGFLAYINGQLVASRNAPASPQWNSTATAARADADTLVFEEILIGNTPGLLMNGTNVLAIQGLNVSAGDADFLVLPELQGMVTGAYAPRYFSPATPGADNASGYLGVVGDPGFSVPRGFYDVPFVVGITTAPAGASIYYTTNGSAPAPENGILYSAPVPVNGTTLLRAAAFLSGYLPSLSVTHSYLFLNQVLQQPSNPPGYPMTWQASYPADYGMDAGVASSTNYGRTITNDLRAIPTMSIATDFNYLWNASTGICVDATQSGDFWQRPTSLELFEGDNTSDFQINCGVEMQGNAGRDNVRCPKHSFRFVFKSMYGPAKLSYDLLPGSGLSTFNTFILRTAWTDCWATRYSDTSVIPGTSMIGLRYRPEDALLMRDAWVKDSQRAMGGWLAARSDFVHLYVNGLYWGVYNDSEHMDADFVAAHLGGRSEDWDLLIGDDTTAHATPVDGSLVDWTPMMAAVNAGMTNEAAYQGIGQVVDIDNLIDYMLIHIYAEAEDWPQHNWYAAHRHATNGLPATKWVFITWDQDITLDQRVRRNRIDVNNDDTPARIYSQLRAWPEFRVRFGDRIQKHLFNDGALTPTNNIARLMARAARIDHAIVAESARWGDARKYPIGANPGTGQTFTRDEWWVPELQGLYTNYFVTLNETNLARFRAGNLYPSLGPPMFSPFGGYVPAGFTLVITHTNASGAIYFTSDGSDPRVYGTGAIAPAAAAYGTPIPINQPTLVRARVRSGTNWSALVEATFTPPQDLSKLALTEIMYNPPAFGAFAGNDLEFLELKNVGTNQLDLSGLTFTAGITFTFTNRTLLGPGQFFVLARDAAAFAVRYPGVAVNGVYSGQLDNGGETVTLSFPLGGSVFSVTYDDSAPWPVTPDGQGFSLVPKQPGLSQAPDNGASWRSSTSAGGSPGADDPAPNIPPIVINELLTHTDPPEMDSVELYNPTGTNVDISGWFLTDDSNTPRKYRLQNGTIISAHGYLFFDESQFNTGTGGNIAFALGATGDSVYLFSALTNSQLTGYSHGFAFGAMFNGVAFGRYVNSAGDELLPMEISPTFGATNSGPRIGPVVITEIHYHPTAGEDEFVELFNITSNSVPLFDPVNPANTWKFNGLGFIFPTNIILGPNQLLLLVATNPAAFRTKYGVPGAVQILGPVPGTLQHNGETLSLMAPDSPNGTNVPYVAMEEVRYNDKAPWPPDADGGGASLQRRSALAFGNDPVNWTAAAPTPGWLGDAEDSDGDGLPDGWELAHGTDWKVPDADADPDHDGFSNLQEFLAGTDPQDPQGNLKLQAQLGTDGTVTLQFLAISNRSYSLLYKDSLSAPSWTKLADFPARDTNWGNSFADAIGGLTNRFYRAELLQLWP